MQFWFLYRYHFKGKYSIKLLILNVALRYTGFWNFRFFSSMVTWWYRYQTAYPVINALGPLMPLLISISLLFNLGFGGGQLDLVIERVKTKFWRYCCTLHVNIYFLQQILPSAIDPSFFASTLGINGRRSSMSKSHKSAEFFEWKKRSLVHGLFEETDRPAGPWT